MLKLQRALLALVVSLMLLVIATPAFGQGNAGCKNGKFVGSYTNSSTFTDIWGDGSNVNHTFVTQLNLHSDGTATEDNTGFPDIMLSSGTATQFIGSWTCRQDGRLVVTMISAVFGTTTDAINHPATVPSPPPVDLFLFANSRVTLLFTVTDDNTLTRTQSRRRVYPADGDPSDPTAGTLRPLSTAVVVFKRLVASDADLLAP